MSVSLLVAEKQILDLPARQASAVAIGFLHRIDRRVLEFLVLYLAPPALCRYRSCLSTNGDACGHERGRTQTHGVVLDERLGAEVNLRDRTFSLSVLWRKNENRSNSKPSRRYSPASTWNLSNPSLSLIPHRPHHDRTGLFLGLARASPARLGGRFPTYKTTTATAPFG